MYTKVQIIYFVSRVVSVHAQSHISGCLPDAAACNVRVYVIKQSLPPIIIAQTISPPSLSYTLRHKSLVNQKGIQKSRSHHHLVYIHITSLLTLTYYMYQEVTLKVCARV